MPTSVLMPSLSPTMEEGVLAKWLVKEGDFVKQGTLLCSVETDKTTVDYESMDEGFLRKIVLPEKTQAKVNQLIAVLTETKDEDIGEFLQKAQEKSQKLLTAKIAPVAPVPSALAPPILSTRSPEDRRSGEERRLKASPLARKVAVEAGIPIGAVQGSGPSGRVIRRDVEAFKTNPPATEGPGVAFGAQLPPAVTQDIPLSMMRRTIARRLLESTQSIPVFAVTLKVDAEPLNELRSQLKRGPGYKVSVNDIIVKASAFALRRHPAVNSSFHGEFIRQHGNVDVGVAVSLDGGLITPIVKHADQKSLWNISEEVKALVAKARAGKLAPDEYQGGTFTVSNLGMYGVDEFTAIINPPQAAILSVGGAQPEIALDAQGIPRQKSVMKITLNADHRAIDGALAAQFLSTLKSALENPAWLLF